MRIRNTLLLDEIEVSEACLAESDSEVPRTVAAGQMLSFDATGNLPNW
jgi:hypothetical protein